jgi:long-chain acyl-CoA synthetase
VRSALGAGLLAAGIPPGSALGLYSSNCPAWVLLDAAAAAYSMVSVPLYDSLGPQAVQYIINHAELAAVGCSTAALPKLLACLQECPTVRLVVVWEAHATQQQQQQQQQHSNNGTTASCSSSSAQDVLQDCLPPGSDPPLPQQQLPSGVSCKLVSLAWLVSCGRAQPHPHVPPQSGDTATICYTSGTTGMPKGRSPGSRC